MAFLRAAARYITIGLGASDSTIRGKAPNTSKVGIRPLRPTKSLIALKAIYKAISLLISGSSVVIIRYIRRRGP